MADSLQPALDALTAAWNAVAADPVGSRALHLAFGADIDGGSPTCANIASRLDGSVRIIGDAEQAQIGRALVQARAEHTEPSA